MPKFVRRGREFWGKLVAEYEREGSAEAHAGFAERHGVLVGSFRRWLYRLRDEQQGRRARTRRGDATLPAVVPWPLVEIQAARVERRFEIDLPGGRRLWVPESFDAEALRRLLAIFDERAAA